MSYVPPPPRRRNVIVDPDGTTRMQDDAAGHVRRFFLRIFLIAAILLVAFVWIGNARLPFVVDIPFLDSIHDVSSKISSNFIRVVRALFDAM